MNAHKQHIRLSEDGRVRRGSLLNLIVDILDGLYQEHPGPLFIAVGGPGGTGKSTFSQKLKDQLNDAVVLKLDDYKTSRATRQKEKLFGPHPSANRMELIASHLTMLRDGQSIESPVYDRITGESTRSRKVIPNRWIILDGEVSTYAPFRKFIDFAIFIDSHWRTQLATRLGRDLDVRGYSPDKAVTTFLNSNLREFVEHGAESKQWADLHLFCHEDYRLELEFIDQSIYEKVRYLFHGKIKVLDIEGLVVPVLTPFDNKGAISPRFFVEHLDWLADAGVQRILTGGYTGEGFSLSGREKLQLLKLALEYFPGLLMFHLGSGPLSEVVTLAEEAAQLGADALVCSLPEVSLANVPEALLNYLAAIKNATTLPLYFELPPSRAHSFLSADTLQIIQSFNGLIDLEGCFATENIRNPRFIGDDALPFSLGMRKPAGFFSGAANAIPELFLELEHSLSGETDIDRIAQLGECIQRLGVRRISAIKHLLNVRMHHYPSAVRPPLSPVPGAAAQDDARALWESLNINQNRPQH